MMMTSMRFLVQVSARGNAVSVFDNTNNLYDTWQLKGKFVYSRQTILLTLHYRIILEQVPR